MHALATSYAQGDPSKAKELLSLIKESEEGIIKPFDPRIKMLGAVNRDNITCFLDALLFAMFMTTECFEKMLYDNPIDEKKKRFACLLRLWVNTLRVGKLITPDLVILNPLLHFDTRQLTFLLRRSSFSLHSLNVGGKEQLKPVNKTLQKHSRSSPKRWSCPC